MTGGAVKNKALGPHSLAEPSFRHRARRRLPRTPTNNGDDPKACCRRTMIASLESARRGSRLRRHPGRCARPCRCRLRGWDGQSGSYPHGKGDRVTEQERHICDQHQHSARRKGRRAGRASRPLGSSLGHGDNPPTDQSERARAQELSSLPCFHYQHGQPHIRGSLAVAEFKALF